MDPSRKYTKYIICPKCGSCLVTTDYDKDKNIMLRKCSECGWETEQYPLDATPTRGE